MSHHAAPSVGRFTQLARIRTRHVPPDGSERRRWAVKVPCKHRRMVNRGAAEGGRPMDRLLRAAFPGRSQGEIAGRAASYLGVSDRTVRNWLDGTHEPKLGHALQLVGLVGWDRFPSIVEGREGGGRE